MDIKTFTWQHGAHQHAGNRQQLSAATIIESPPLGAAGSLLVSQIQKIKVQAVGFIPNVGNDLAQWKDLFVPWPLSWQGGRGTLAPLDLAEGQQSPAASLLIAVTMERWSADQ